MGEGPCYGHGQRHVAIYLTTFMFDFKPVPLTIQPLMR
jgi:hypothetical protein